MMCRIISVGRLVRVVDGLSSTTGGPTCLRWHFVGGGRERDSPKITVTTNVKREVNTTAIVLSSQAAPRLATRNQDSTCFELS